MGANSTGTLPTTGSAKLSTQKQSKSSAPAKKTYRCTCCGQEYSKQTTNFPYLQSGLYDGNDHYGSICFDCIDKLHMDIVAKTGDERAACRRICMLLDLYYSPVIFDGTMRTKTTKTRMGAYCSIAALRQYQGKTFEDTIKEEAIRAGEFEHDAVEGEHVKWSKADIQNQKYVESTIGYDPFDDCGLTESDRKFCFNILAGYCDIDGLAEDGHKIQSVVQMTKSQLQCKKIDEILNRELLADHPNDEKIKILSATKKQLLDGITKMAQDNNISSAYNTSSKQGTNTLSSKMKEMMQIGFDKVEVNLFDIKTCQAMRQIADLSNESIMAQLTFDSNDYTEMLKDQRELLNQYREEAERLREENRILRNKMMENGVE